jgi:cell division septum initiation protein DivIVA
MRTQLSSAAEVRASRFESGRGYRQEAVDTFRTEVAELVDSLERRNRQLQDAVDALRAELATQNTGVDLRELLRNADPEIIKAEASAAAGEVLALAVDAADRHTAKTRSETSAVRNRAINLLEEIVDAAKQARQPDYELHRLVVTASGLIERLRSTDTI